MIPAPKEAEAPPDTPGVPDEGAFARLLESMPHGMRGQSALLVAILVLMVGYTLYLAQEIVVPLVLAIILNLLLSPLVRRLKRLHVPEPLGAAVVVFGLLGLIVYGVYGLSAPAAEWAGRAPHNLAEMAQKLKPLKQPVEEATKQVEKLAEEVTPDQGTQAVKVQQQSWTELFVFGTTSFLTQTFVVVALVYFLLAAGDTFMRRFVKALSTGQDKRAAVSIVHAVQRDVTVYLVTTTIISVGVGVATGVAMAAIGMPNPVLWGVVAGVLNIIPYAGAVITYAILTFVAVLSFDELGQAMLAPGLFAIINMTESYVVTPYAVGNRLTLNPAIVFGTLVVWSWLWGVAGAVLAVPLLVVLKAFADHLPSWQGISIFLGRREE